MKVFRTTSRARESKTVRRGIAALIALVCLSLATIVGTILLRSALGEHQYLNRVELKSQADWLVEAGFSRAAAQIAKSAEYSGETWKVPGASFGRNQDAVVQIAAGREPSSAIRRHVAVTVTFSQSNEPAIEAARDFASH
jgi:type II secretory pathway component PulK